MYKNELSNYLSTLNSGLTSQEILLEYNCKIESMLDILLLANLGDYSYATLHQYLCIISDFVEQAKVLNENIITDNHITA